MLLIFFFGEFVFPVAQLKGISRMTEESFFKYNLTLYIYIYIYYFKHILEIKNGGFIGLIDVVKLE